MDRFDRRDARFVAVCLLIIAAGALTTAALFRRAFPEAEIRFRVNRTQARAQAEAFLAERGRSTAGTRFAGRFSVDEVPKVYLERELGLEKAGRLYGTEAKVWRWDMRWVRSGVKEEDRVSLTPLGDLVGFDFVRRDDAPGPRPAEDEARAVALAFLSSRGLPEDRLRHIESTPTSRPNRTDWTFMDERIGSAMGEATVRFRTTVSGGHVTGFRELVHVPESWRRGYAGLRSKNETAGAVATLGLFVTFLAMIVVLVRKIVLHDVRWRLVAAFGLTAFVLALLSSFNGIGLKMYEDYDTASSLSSFLTNQIVFGILGAIAIAAGIAFVVAAAEPMYRERFPDPLSLSGLFSRRGIRTRSFFRGVLLGYALVAFFFAYQAVFYVVAAKFGAWSPADVPYDDMLSTAVPWATVLLIGFLPAVSEEGISRMFSISLLDRIGAGRILSVVIPAAIWGFGHAAYPNQPFYIRGVEVGLAGVAIGFLMRRFGVWPLLVWHFTVDALYTALVMLRSGNTYYVVSGAIAAGILLIPLGVSLALYWKNGGFVPDAGLSNRDEGFVPEPASTPAPLEEVAGVRRLSPAVRGIAIVAAVFLALTFLIPAAPASDAANDRTGRRRAESIARSFLTANGVHPDVYRSVSYTGTGFAEWEDVRDAEPEEHGSIPGFSSAAARYVLSQGGLPAFERLSRRELPLALWVVRFFQPEKKEEWKVLLDAGRARVVGFLNPTDETAPDKGSPDRAQAEARARAAAAALGYPEGDYSVVDLGTKERPKRSDTTVVLEARPKGIGEARPRIAAVFHGRRLAAVYPSVWIPESYLRDSRKRSAGDWIVIAVKVVAAGGLVGIGLVLFLRLVRSPSFRWKSIAAPLAAAGLLAAAAAANRVSTAFRVYDTQQPLRLFFVGVGVSVTVLWLGSLLLAAVGFALFSGARPGWLRAMRRRGTLRDAAFRAAAGAAGLAGLSHLASLAATRYPALFEPDPSLPSGLASTVPPYAAVWSVILGIFALAVVAATAALAIRQPFLRTPLGAGLAIAAILVAAVPARLASPGEWLASYLPNVAILAWLAFCVLGLLADHAAAWVLFGCLAFGGPILTELWAQGAAEDRAIGWTALVLLAAAAAAALAGRRTPSDPPAALPVPEPPTLAPVA